MMLTLGRLQKHFVDAQARIDEVEAALQADEA
jgi:hypothetical protein